VKRGGRFSTNARSPSAWPGEAMERDVNSLTAADLQEVSRDKNSTPTTAFYCRNYL